VGNKEILILIDSGSSCTFISDKIIQGLNCAVSDTAPVSVTVANGQKISSSQQVTDFQWWAQGHTFTHNARVLAISCYDLVLGMDWLERHSPMWIHWKRKLLRFSHNGQRIALKGMKDSPTYCHKIKVRKLTGLIRKGGLAQVVHLCPVLTEPAPSVVPAEVQQFIDSQSAIFREPDSLPPERVFDHHIPLLPGVKPVNVSPIGIHPVRRMRLSAR